LRLGLCCAFAGEPIRFRRTTASYLARSRRRERLAFLRDLAADNARALGLAVDWCAARGVGAFRITSQLLPVYTHPQTGYSVEEIDRGGGIAAAFAAVRERARSEGVRLSFHPDQFVVPGSVRDDVALRSIAELEYMGLVAELVGAEQITLHGGGAQGGKKEALDRLARALGRLTDRARTRIALENDDRVYTVEDLLPLCRAEGIPLVYDAHHHRCHPDSLPVEEATGLSARTWGSREPWAHISSPRGGWRSPAPRLHADFIRFADFPAAWRGRRMTVDVEAKSKELAVLRLRAQLG
jgi:UV DNA damage endonuclease